MHQKHCIYEITSSYSGKYKFHFVRLVYQLTSQQCSSLTPNQHQSPVTSQPAVLFFHNKSAPATTKRTEIGNVFDWLIVGACPISVSASLSCSTAREAAN